MQPKNLKVEAPKVRILVAGKQTKAVFQKSVATPVRASVEGGCQCRWTF
jgi:hypothetical protein